MNTETQENQDAALHVCQSCGATQDQPCSLMAGDLFVCGVCRRKHREQGEPAKPTDTGHTLEARVVALSSDQDSRVRDMVGKALAEDAGLWNDTDGIHALLDAAHEVMTVHQNCYSTFHRVCKDAFEDLDGNYSRAVFAESAAVWVHRKLNEERDAKP